MAFTGGQYTTTGTAVSIASALSITAFSKKPYRQVILRTVAGAGVNYYGPAALTLAANRAGQLLGTDLAPTAIGTGDALPLNIDEIFLVGDGTVVFITLVQ